MANQHVTIDGVKYGVWYMHCRRCDSIILDNRFDDTLDDALALGQIKEHKADPCAPYVTAITRCQLELEDRSVASTGYAFCSEDDNFSKSRGRNISLARAIQWLKRR